VLKAGKLFKEICLDLKHETCICHCLHNLCETIRRDNDLVDAVIAYIKKKLTKNRKNQTLLSTICDISVPEFPILTRLWTWIRFACFGFEIFDTVKTFIENLVQMKTILSIPLKFLNLRYLSLN
jgi:hypothetical protein